MSNFKKLIVWQKAIELVSDIYNVTSKLPKDETYGLMSQMKRSSVSILSNIVEGTSYRTNKEYNHYQNITVGSALELETQLIVSKNLDFISENQFNDVNSKLMEIQKC